MIIRAHNWESLARMHYIRGDMYRACLCMHRHWRNVLRYLPPRVGVVCPDIRPLSDFKRSR